MPDIALIFALVLLMGTALFFALESSSRPALGCLGLIALLAAWLVYSHNAPRSAIESEFYKVVTVTSPDGVPMQVIATKDGPVNVNKVLGGYVPEGVRVHRIVYSGWRRGIYWTDQAPEYAIADEDVVK